ncbi:MAG: VCBS repeat-containing protein, partial [Planctomycetota bacterium]
FDRILFDDTPPGFARPITTVVDLSSVPGELFSVSSAVDVDGNGLKDLILFDPNGQQPLQVVYGIGEREFSGPVPFGVFGSPRAADVLDADGDGDLDLATLTADGALEVRENDGSAFPWPVAWSEDIGFDGFGIQLLPDDVDDDGAIDLIVLRGEARVHLGGANGFATTAVFPAADLQLRNWLIDVDGDGDNDILSASIAVAGTGPRWLERTGPTSFAASSMAVPGASELQGATPADLDGDGRPEVYGTVFGFPLQLGVLDLPLGPSGGTVRTLPRGPIVRDLALGDFDGDGDVDLVTSGSNEGIAVHERVARRETRIANRVTPSGVQSFGLPLVSVSIGAGARSAVAFMDGSGDFFLVEEPLAAAPQAPRPLGGGYFVDTAAPTAGDVDGDGDDDLVLLRSDGSALDWIEQVAPLDFAAPTALLAASAPADFERFFLADFDLDGVLDVVTVEDSGGQTQVRTHRRVGAGYVSSAPTPVAGNVLGVEPLRLAGLDVLVSDSLVGGLQLTGHLIDPAGALTPPVLWIDDDTPDVVRGLAVLPESATTGVSARIYVVYSSFATGASRLQVYVPGLMISEPVETADPDMFDVVVFELDGDGPELVLPGDGVWTQRPVFAPDTAGTATPFCFEQTTGSAGRAGQLDVASERTAAGPMFLLDRLRFDLFDLPPQRTVLLLASRSPAFVAAPGGALGSLCLGAPIGRLLGPGQVLSTNTRGTASLDLDTSALPLGGALVPVSPGEQWFFQAWYRDVEGGGQSSRFTNGVSARL